MLERIYWDNSYSVGYTDIDVQHQKLIDICNDLADNIENKNAPKEEFHEILHRLSEYSRLHFEDEESIIRKCGFPELEEHIKKHDEYREHTVNVFMESYGYVSHKQKVSLHKFLASWWKDHILLEDMKFKHVVMYVIPD